MRRRKHLPHLSFPSSSISLISHFPHPSRFPHLHNLSSPSFFISLISHFLRSISLPYRSYRSSVGFPSFLSQDLPFLPLTGFSSFPSFLSQEKKISSSPTCPSSSSVFLISRTESHVRLLFLLLLDLLHLSLSTASHSQDLPHICRGILSPS